MSAKPSRSRASSTVWSRSTLKPMPRHRRSRTNWLGPILVALIVGAVAWTVNDRLPGMVSNVPNSATSTPSIASVSGTHMVVGLGIPAPKADRDQRLLIDLDSGSSTKVTVPAGWRTSSLLPATGLSLVPYGDGFKVSGTDWDIVLRRENGQLYIDPQILGLLDPTHAVVIARISSAQEILVVNRAGGITKLTDMPDNANVLGLVDGSVWLSTFIPGEGIESEPHGPSKLIRIEADGSQTVEATSEQVITRVVAGYGSFVYDIDGNEEKPLLWLSS